jgi:hypothetical protein
MIRFFAVTVLCFYSIMLPAQEPPFDYEGDFVEGYFITEMYLYDIDSSYDPIPYSKEFRERMYIMVVQFSGKQEYIFSINYAQSGNTFALANVMETDCSLLITEEQDFTEVTCYMGKIVAAEFKDQDGSYFIFEKLDSPPDDDNEYARFIFLLDSGSNLQAVGRKYFSSED